MKLSLVADAREFAVKAHSGQMRRGKVPEPYTAHLEEVADLVHRSGGDTEEIAAAWLHDTIEDTDTTLEDIQFRFGDTVAAIVLGLTDSPHMDDLSTLKRKTLQATCIKEKSDSVKRVKLADQISNVRAVALDPPVKWSMQKRLDYITGAQRIARECRGISLFLDVEFIEVYRKASLIYV